jgi:hypothetical protein
MTYPSALDTDDIADLASATFGTPAPDAVMGPTNPRFSTKNNHL